MTSVHVHRGRYTLYAGYAEAYPCLTLGTVARLAIIFTQLFSVSKVPFKWKEAVITPVFKKGAADNVSITTDQGCSLGLDVSVSRRSRDVVSKP